MIELRVLGSLDLRGSDGRELHAVLRRPKRLALLAYLAAARPRGFHRRDALLAVFWPDLDQAHARNALRQAVHFLREAVGHDVVVARGDEELGVDARALRSDVADFEDRLDGRDPESALAWYHGDLLAGFHVSEAPEFERWLDQERDHLRRRAVGAALALAEREEARGSALGAARWATRACEISPYDESALRRLLRLLDGAGNRADAVREYDEFARRLTTDLDVEPAPETRALIAAIRARDAAQDVDQAGAPTEPSRPAPVGGRARRGWRGVSLRGALVLALVLAAWLLGGLRASGAEHRVAVLPFENIGAPPEQDYLADGLTEEIILELARFGNLKPISRTSAMRYKGSRPDPRDVGRELGVEAVMEGSIRLVDSRVRITAKLIDARTNEYLWSDVYERDLTDLFEIQADVALQIARSLDARLAEGAQERAQPHATRNPAAYREYLKGRHLTWGPEPVKAIEYYQRAIDLDSVYARAYAGLADVYGQLGVLGSLPPREAFAQAKAAAERAIALDAALPEAHTALGAVDFWYGWDWKAAAGAYRRAFQLGRTEHLDHYVAYLTAMGRPAEAIREAERRLELDPLSPTRNLALAWTYFMAASHDEAIAQLRHTLELHPGFAWAHVELAWNYAFTGRHREAVAEARRAMELVGGAEQAPGGSDFAFASLAHVFAVAGERDEALRILHRLEATSHQRYVDPFKLAVVHAGLGDVERAFGWLERAYATRSPQMVYLKPMSQHFLAPLRSDPRYRALLERMRLPK